MNTSLARELFLLAVVESELQIGRQKIILRSEFDSRGIPVDDGATLAQGASHIRGAHDLSDGVKLRLDAEDGARIGDQEYVAAITLVRQLLIDGLQHHEAGVVDDAAVRQQQGPLAPSRGAR